MGRELSALAAGFVFGLGLAVSRMVDPAKVVGFLDVAGDWDPSLALVMVGAIAVSIVAFRMVLRRPHPVLSSGFQVPKPRDIDGRLIGGSALFGVGWGLVGLCPGPAIASLAYAMPQSVAFVAAMIAGFAAARLLPPRPAEPEPASA